jgi:hypothetical protein
MGRPPLGKVAMTPAEKQRRYRERKFGNRPPVAKPDRKLFERLHRHALDSEKRNPALASDLRLAAEALLMRPSMTSGDSAKDVEITTLKARIAELAAESASRPRERSKAKPPRRRVRP